jgi:hypothetical protein
MIISPPPRRKRIGFLRAGAWVSALAFLAIEGYALHDQWEIGHASAMFMLGTALFIAGICIGLFAIIVAIGSAVSIFFDDEYLPEYPSERRSISQRQRDRSPQQSTPLLSHQTKRDKATTPPLEEQETLPQVRLLETH